MFESLYTSLSKCLNTAKISKVREETKQKQRKIKEKFVFSAF